MGPSSKIAIILLLCAPCWSETRYVSTTGNDANLCTTGSRCATFNRAYQLSVASDVVMVAAGSYSSQTILRNASVTGSNKQSPDGTEVTFRPESGPSTVTIDGLVLSDGAAGPIVQHVALEDMTITGWMHIRSATDFHLTRMTLRYVFQINCVDYWSIRDSDIGDHNEADSADLYGNVCAAGAGHPAHGLMEGNEIHHVSSTDPGAHPDAIALFATTGGINGFILRRNKFHNNACINIRGDVGSNYVIENNYFGATVAFAGGIECGVNSQLHGDGALIRFNTFEGAIQQPGAGEADGQYWVGNIVTGNIGYGQCPTGSGTIAEYNVLGADNVVSCGGANNTLVGSFASYFVSTTGTSADFLKLTTNATAAIDAVPTSVAYPATDYHGSSRPFGTANDAGAFEYGAGGAPTPTSGRRHSIARR